jgi:hypothetical protein
MYLSFWNEKPDESAITGTIKLDELTGANGA